MNKKAVQDYLVILKNPNIQLVERTGWLMAALSILILIVQLFAFPKSVGLYATLFVVLVFLISNIIEKRKKKNISFSYLLIATGVGLSFFGDGPNSN
ncbi:MAG: hypothetical protein RI991_675, partial [Bacteroidota bacterium]